MLLVRMHYFTKFSYNKLTMFIAGHRLTVGFHVDSRVQVQAVPVVTVCSQQPVKQTIESIDSTQPKSIFLPSLLSAALIIRRALASTYIANTGQNVKCQCQCNSSTVMTTIQRHRGELHHRRLHASVTFQTLLHAEPQLFRLAYIYNHSRSANVNISRLHLHASLAAMEMC